MEFLHSHTNVVAQPSFDDRRYYGINPYALGFAMMKDIERICVNPQAEDRQMVSGYRRIKIRLVRSRTSGRITATKASSRS